MISASVTAMPPPVLEPPPAKSYQVLGAAKSVLESCQGETLTSIYSHDNTHSDIELKVNCYGFLRFLLNSTCPGAYESVRQFMEDSEKDLPLSIDKIPCPFHYAAFFASLSTRESHEWEPVPNTEAPKPGDIIVYLPPGYQPQVIEKMPTVTTETHVMIVKEVGHAQADQIELTIIDCSRKPHCQEDTRSKEGGIGQAPVTLDVSKDPPTLRWGSQKKIWKKDLFFGRLRD